MDPVRRTVTHMAGEGSSPRSPQQNRSPSSRNSPTAERRTSATSSNEAITSPKPDCAICLEKLENKCFTDSCQHQFCFSCLVKWSKVNAVCPVCKEEFKTIIHSIRSNVDYDEYHVQTGAENPDPRNSTVNNEVVQHVHDSTTPTHNQRLVRSREHTERSLQHGVEPGAVPSKKSWRQRCREAPFNFRVSVYRENLWVNSLLINGQPRDISPDQFRRHPEEVQRLVPWLKRELFAILRSLLISENALERVLKLLPEHEMHSRYFYSRMENFLGQDCDHFIHELYNFARSPYDMDGFDKYAAYSRRINIPMHVVHEVSSDSDVVILPSDDTQPPSATRRQRTRAVRLRSRSRSPVAGPSRAVLPVDEPSPNDANA